MRTCGLIIYLGRKVSCDFVWPKVFHEECYVVYRGIISGVEAANDSLLVSYKDLCPGFQKLLKTLHMVNPYSSEPVKGHLITQPV